MPPTGIQKVFAALQAWEDPARVIFDEKCSENLPKLLPSFTQRLFKKLLYEHICKHGDLTERRQKPEHEWEADFFYFSIPVMDGKRVYVKMILTEEDEDDLEVCCTLIVSLHDPSP